MPHGTVAGPCVVPGLGVVVTAAHVRVLRQGLRGRYQPRRLVDPVLENGPQTAARLAPYGQGARRGRLHARGRIHPGQVHGADAGVGLPPL